MAKKSNSFKSKTYRIKVGVILAIIIFLILAVCVAIPTATAKIDYNFEGLPEYYPREQILNLKERNRVFLKNELPRLHIDGYKFLGYYQNGKKVTKIKPFTFNANLTVKFQKMRYNLHYNHIGISNNLLGNIENDNNPVDYTIEDYCELSDLKLRGCNFLGYYLDNERITKINKGTFGDKTIICKWNYIEYYFNYINESVSGKIFQGEVEATTLPQKYTMEDSVTFPQLSCKGYEFIGYFIGNNGITEISKGNVGDMDIICRWKPINYEIRYNNISVTGNKFIGNIRDLLHYEYNLETKFNYRPLIADGYEFVGCYENNNICHADYFKFMTGDKYFELRWKPKEYNIFYDSRYGEESNKNITKYNIESKSIDLQGLNFDNYQFKSWQRNGEDITQIPSGSFGNIELEAKWAMVGAGTTESPYLIYNEDQLKTLFKEMDAHYQMQNNIVVSYTWHPIGTETAKFTGVFDGNGQTLTISEIEGNIKEFGIFGYIGLKGKVKNLIVDSTSGSWADNFVCSRFAGIGLYNEGLIESCTNRIKLTVKAEGFSGDSIVGDKRFALGGICYQNNNKILNCNNEGSLKIYGSRSALLSGIVILNASANAVVEDCNSNEELIAFADNLIYAGKFVAIMEKGGVLKHKADIEITLQDVKKLNDVSGIKAELTKSGNVGQNAVRIRPVGLNMNTGYGAEQEGAGRVGFDDGYAYWKMIPYEHKYLEGWIKYKYKEGANPEALEHRQLLNKSGKWEVLSAENGWGANFVKNSEGGYVYETEK